MFDIMKHCVAIGGMACAGAWLGTGAWLSTAAAACGICMPVPVNNIIVYVSRKYFLQILPFVSHFQFSVTSPSEKANEISALRTRNATSNSVWSAVSVPFKRCSSPKSLQNSHRIFMQHKLYRQATASTSHPCNLVSVIHATQFKKNHKHTGLKPRDFTCHLRCKIARYHREPRTFQF
jgi:hypothetical protein